MGDNVANAQRGRPREFETRLRAAIDDANIPTLLMVVVQLTGDLRWLADPYRPTTPKGVSDNDDGGLSSEIQSEIRAAASDAILAWHRGERVAIPQPSEELLRKMLSVAMGEPIPQDHGPMLAAELGHDWSPTAEDRVSGVPPGFGVVVVGAGVSGLLAAIRLQAAGIPFTVMEKNGTVGGTWLENQYPGAGVDSPNHLYSYSFAQYDWCHYFESQNELQAYLEHIASKFDLWKHIRFDTEVIEAAYEAHEQGWKLRVRDGDGSELTVRASVLISAVGIFNPATIPDIPRREEFDGPAFHTARWPEDVDLTKKKVAVVGTGASAMQVVPAVAASVERLVVFQRSPQWALPFEKFQKPIPESIRWLLREVPLYQRWYRARLGWTFNDTIYPTLRKDPAWPHPERSLNETNDRHRAFLTRYIESELGDRVDLFDKVLPTYPPYGKRMLLDNGWFRTVTRSNVEVVTERITNLERDGIRTESGRKHDVDVIVWATGFAVAQLLTAFEIRGRSGRTIREAWDGDDARAFIMGTTVPDFPNFFCLYGPNSQPATGGSIMFTLEAQMHYIMSILRRMLADEIGSVECRTAAWRQYNGEVDGRLAEMVWTHPGTDNYYRNSRGRVVVICPFRYSEIWEMTRDANLDDYLTERRRG